MSKERFVVYDFPGITVLVPKQSDIVAVDKGSFTPNKIQKVTKPFTMIRQIANIVFYKKADVEKTQPVTEFEPPIEIRVGYNIYDVIKSHGDHKKLKLAYWDGSQWVIISNAEHDYRILPPSTGQVAEAKIRSWAGDPPVAWGT
jgi:hypothetical protein